jgi:hypothetical protein
MDKKKVRGQSGKKHGKTEKTWKNFSAFFRFPPCF